MNSRLLERRKGINLVVPRGFEPLSRPNLGLTVYKAAALPLCYRTIACALPLHQSTSEDADTGFEPVPHRLWYSTKDLNLDSTLIRRVCYHYNSGVKFHRDRCDYLYPLRCAIFKIRRAMVFYLNYSDVGGHGESRTLNASVQAKQYPVYLHAQILPISAPNFF